MHRLIVPLNAAPGASLGSIALGGLALLIFFVLNIFVESVTLQFLGWGEFKSSLRASAWMNLASLLVGFGALALVTRLGLPALLISWALSVPIEALVLKKTRTDQTGHFWRAAILCNLVSYLLLILPTYFMSD